MIINENYRIEADSYSYALQERKIVKSGKSEGEEKWESISFHKTLDKALIKLREIARKNLISEDTGLKIDEVVSELRNLDERLISEIQKTVLAVQE